MRNRIHLTLALVAAIALGTSACSQPPREPGQDPAADLPAPPAEQTDQDTSNDVYDLESEGEFPPPPRDVEFEEDQLPPPETLPATPIGAAVDTVGGEDVEPETIEPSVEVPVEPASQGERRADTIETARGWRVQLAAAGARSDADRVAREASARLGVKCYVDFEAPLFKVRAGDFVDRAEALRLRDRARANGYDGAWIVTTEVVSGRGS
jgi:cell division septation protein DedD